jgi:hypothetical protein
MSVAPRTWAVNLWISQQVFVASFTKAREEEIRFVISAASTNVESTSRPEFRPALRLLICASTRARRSSAFVRNRLLRVAVLTVLPDSSLVDPPDFGPPEVRQEHFQAVIVIGARYPFGEEAGREFAEGHLGSRLADAEALQVQVVLETLVDHFRQPAVPGARRFGVPDAVHVHITPVNPAALPKTHTHHLLSVFCFSRIQRVT